MCYAFSHWFGSDFVSRKADTCSSFQKPRIGKENATVPATHSKNKIVSEYLNLLMENPESCWKGKSKNLYIPPPPVKGMFRLSLILVLPSVLLVQTERKSQNYSESKTQFFSIIRICPQLDLCSLCFECFLAFLSPIRCISVHLKWVPLSGPER